MSEKDVAFEATVATPGSGRGGAGISTLKDRHQGLAEQFLGQILGGRYLLKRIVGAGGFGAVFEGEDQRIKKRVAVKLLFADLLRDREAVTRFKLEAEAASQVGHRNIIDITDFDFTDEGVAYLVMEFLEGEDLAHIIRRSTTPDLPRMVRLCLQATRGLGAAHRKGIIHRDLKPGNLFVAAKEGEAEELKVVDFGISRASELDEAERLTKTGQILGTPYYMAPEQADGIREVDGRADIYSMGVILFEACTGRLPFIARTPIGLITKHASEPPPEPASLNAAIPVLLQNIILKCLEKEPGNRFPEAGALEEALLYALGALDPTAEALERSRTGTGSEGKEKRLSEEVLVALSTPSIGLQRTAAGGLSTGSMSAAPPRRPLLLAVVGLGALVLGVVVTLSVLRTPTERKGEPEPKAANVAARDAALPARTPGGADAAALRPTIDRPREAAPADAATPKHPPQVELTCRTQQKDVRVTDRDDKVTYGVCPGVFKVPHGLVPMKIVFRKTGHINRTEEVLPNRSQELPFIALTPLRVQPRAMLPDDVIPK